MKVELSVFERLWLLNNALPSRGRIHLVRVAQEIATELGLSVEELGKLNPTEGEDGSLSWTMEGVTAVGMKELDIPDVIAAPMAEVLKAEITRLDELEQVDMGMLTLHDKFVGE